MKNQEIYMSDEGDILLPYMARVKQKGKDRETVLGPFFERSFIKAKQRILKIIDDAGMSKAITRLKIERVKEVANPGKKKKKEIWAIQDWAGNWPFGTSQKYLFKSFDDAEEFLSQYIYKQYGDLDDKEWSDIRGEYEIVLLK